MNLDYHREKVEQYYGEYPTGCGGSFGEVLCYEIHCNNRTFRELAEFWGISVTLLGLLIADHCAALEGINIESPTKVR